MEKINWIHLVRNEEMSRTVQEDGNVVQTIKRRKANWIGHTLRRNCLLNQIQGRIEVTGVRGRRRKQLLDILEEKKGYRKLKDEALDSTLWRGRFGRGYGLVRLTTE